MAGGAGTRMGGPKQFLPLCGKTVVEWSLAAFLGLPEVEKIVLVLSGDNIREHGARLASDRVVLVEGGTTRMTSLRNGFRRVPGDIDVVAVHDGARPLISTEVIRAAVKEAWESGASVAAVRVKDTLKKTAADDLRVSETPSRADFWQAQTPQCYRRAILEEALKRFPDDKKATDESQLVEKAGHKVRIVPSSYENLKITTPEDLTMAEALMEARLGGRRTVTGFGYDIHRLVPGRALWLAGIKLPHSKGLLGHSDADAVLHAVCDALLGAAGLGEIGIMFPPDDPKFKDIQSREIMKTVLEKLRAAGAAVEHVDATLVAEEPKLKPHYAAMRESLSGMLGMPVARVNIKAKSHEGLGPVGQGEAIACCAVATVTVPA